MGKKKQKGNKLDDGIESWNEKEEEREKRGLIYSYYYYL